MGKVDLKWSAFIDQEDLWCGVGRGVLKDVLKMRGVEGKLTRIAKSFHGGSKDCEDREKWGGV